MSIANGMELGKEDIGSCDFIDVLEEMATRHGRARVVLSDGSTFVEPVLDVVTEHGVDYGVFGEHGRVAVKEITECTPKYGE